MFAFTLAIISPLVTLVVGQCRCIPSSSCWPSQDHWSQLNTSISGKLIKTVQPAAPCYPASHQDSAACKQVESQWMNASFQAENLIGYDYPLNMSCLLPGQYPPENVPSTCSLGNSPVYAVNATEDSDIVNAIQFAKENNLRLVVKSTGHDFVQRSTGYGSLLVWLYYYRKGYQYSQLYQSINTCSKSTWAGSSLTIRGSYPWSDLYPSAAREGVMLVGGNNQGPSSTGGWMQGGGHSPLTRYFGLGAEQVLSARVILASGEIVDASPCQNEDLFYAIRGGGPGTYGVVIETTVKTFPTTSVNVLSFEFSTPLANMPTFLDALTRIYSSYPYMSKVGFAGYGFWTVANPRPSIPNFNCTYGHSLTLLSSNSYEATQLFMPIAKKLESFNASGFNFTISNAAYETYAAYYEAKSGTVSPVGSTGILNSRLLGETSLTQNLTFLRQTLETVAGFVGQGVEHTLVLHGRAALGNLDTSSPITPAIQPGWYNSVLLDIFDRGYNNDPTADALVTEDILNILSPAYQALSPDTGTYMNEAYFGDPGYQKDFYGTNWPRLNQIKAKYDPDQAFYCQTCVGSESWTVVSNGSLCKT